MLTKILDWFNTKASIRKKLIISFAIMVSVPLLTLGCYIFYKTRENLEQQTASVMENNLTRLVSEMETRVQREEDNSKYLAYHQSFRKALGDAADDKIALANVMNSLVEPVFWYFISSDELLKGITVYTPKLEDNMGAFLRTQDMAAHEEWYRIHQENFRTTWEYEDGRLYATRSILDAGTTSRAIAVMRMEFYPGTFLEPLDSMDYMDNGILLTDGAGNIIYRRLPAGLVAGDGLMESIMDEHSYLLETGVIEPNGWKLYYFISRAEITGQLYEIWKAVVLVIGACVAVIIFLMTVFSRQLSRRILLLKEKAEEVAEGNFEHPAFTKDTDEVGILTNSIGNMTIRLKEMVQQVYVMRIEKQEMELKTLRAMINPHFLYNSLSSVKWKAIREGNDDISILIGHLAKFYRTCLNQDKELTTVRNELDNIRSYVEIQKASHDGSFDCIYVVDEDYLEYTMLNFILQPIVENAIKHGIDYREEQDDQGLLVVEYRLEENALKLRVYNNGPTVTAEELERSISQPGKGYGMYNIRQRLQLYYGGSASLTAAALACGGVCFTISMPVLTEEESIK